MRGSPRLVLHSCSRCWKERKIENTGFTELAFYCIRSFILNNFQFDWIGLCKIVSYLVLNLSFSMWRSLSLFSSCPKKLSTLGGSPKLTCFVSVVEVISRWFYLLSLWVASLYLSLFFCSLLWLQLNTEAFISFLTWSQYTGY